jgi:hypothetical protein
VNSDLYLFRKQNRNYMADVKKKKKTEAEIAAATDSQVENYEDFFQASLTSFIPSLTFPRQL